MKNLLLIAAAMLMAVAAMATDRPAPASFLAEPASIAALSDVDAIAFEALDLDELSRRDARREANGEPVHFAFPHAVSQRAQNIGTWEELGKMSIWRFRVTAADATLINFGFRDVHLPPERACTSTAPRPDQRAARMRGD